MKESGIEWIGKIPCDWEIKKCKYISTLYNGYAFDSKYLLLDYNYPIIRIGDIKDGGVDIEHCQGVNSNIGLDRYKVLENDILLAMSGATVGKIGIVHNIENAYVNQRVGIIRTSDPLFLYYCLSTNDFIDFVLLKANGSAQPNISGEVYGEFIVPYPPLNKRTKIVKYLTKKSIEIDTLTVDIKKQIETLEEHKKSFVFRAVSRGTKDVALKETSSDVWMKIPKNWQLVGIKYIFEIVKRIAGREGYNVLSVTQKGLKIKDIESNNGQQAEDYSGYQFVYPTDYVMNHMDLLTGWVDCSTMFGVTSPDYRVFRLRDKENNNLAYFKHLMQCCYMNRIFYSLGQGVSNLGRWRLQTSSFNNFMIPVPPLKEQQQIANYLDKKCSEIDSIISTKAKQLETLTEYKKSLIYEYVTGKKEV